MNEQNWEAVAKAIRERLDELGVNQRELADRSGVSVATIRELTYNYAARRRSPRTLRSISAGLDWPPGYLEAVLNGGGIEESARTAEAAATSVVAESQALTSQLVLVLQHVKEIREDVRDIKRTLERGRLNKR